MQIASLSGEKSFDLANPFMCDYSEKLDLLIQLNPLNFDLSLHSAEIGEAQYLVPTASIHIAFTIIQPWLENKQHVMVTCFRF